MSGATAGGSVGDKEESACTLNVGAGMTNGLADAVLVLAAAALLRLDRQRWSAICREELRVAGPAAQEASCTGLDQSLGLSSA